MSASSPIPHRQYPIALRLRILPHSIQFNSNPMLRGKLKEKRTCGVDFAVGSDAKEGLFASGQLDGPQGGQGVANCWRFDFGAFDASAQLAAVVVTPSVDLSAADGRPTLRPILRVTVFHSIQISFIQLYSILFNFIQLFSMVFNFIEVYLTLFNGIQAYSILFNFIRICPVLFNFIQFYSILFNFIQLYLTLFNGIQFYSILFNFIQF